MNNSPYIRPPNNNTFYHQPPPHITPHSLINPYSVANPYTTNRNRPSSAPLLHTQSRVSDVQATSTTLMRSLSQPASVKKGRKASVKKGKGKKNKRKSKATKIKQPRKAKGTKGKGRPRGRRKAWKPGDPYEGMEWRDSNIFIPDIKIVTQDEWPMGLEGDGDEEKVDDEEYFKRHYRASLRENKFYERLTEYRRQQYNNMDV
eukprot:UN25581